MSKSGLQIFHEGRRKRHTETWKKSSRAIQICKHLVEKNGIRSIERITGFHRDTIGRLLEGLALHAEYVNDILLNEIKLGEFEVDEMWTMVKKNRKKLSRQAQIQMKKAMHGSTPA